MRKKAKKIIALSTVVGVGVIGGSYAYWNQTATIDNPFNTGTYGTSVVENFSPEKGENWQPGVTIDKEVYVTNEGDYDVIARVKLDESWTYTNQENPYKIITSKDDIYDQDAFDIYIDPAQAEKEDGLTKNDGTVVEKIFNLNSKWIDGGDGWYYYTANVKPGTETDQWLTDVTLAEDVDMGVYDKNHYLQVNNGENWIEYTYKSEKGVPMYYDKGKCYYSIEEAEAADLDTTATFVTKNKSVSSVDESKKGYSDSNYVLSITVETVQATEEAVNATFGDGTTGKDYASAWTYYTDEEI